MRTIRLATLAALTAALFAGFALPARADFVGIQLQGTLSVTSFTCDADGTSRIEYTATGASIANHPGTFTARGSFTLGAQTLPGYPGNSFLPAGRLVGWSEQVTIVGADGTVTAASTGVVTPPPGFGITGVTVNTGTCTNVQGVTLGSVENASGTVIEAFGTVGMSGDGVALPAGAFAATIAARLVIDSSSVGPFEAGSFDQSFFCCASVDASPPLISAPGGLTVDATGPSGAVVTYEVSAQDDVDGAVEVRCMPASGSRLPIGTTTVTCEARDTAANATSVSFAVHVRSAAEQLDELESAVVGAGPGRSLESKVRGAKFALAARRPTDACHLLRAFLRQVDTQRGKTISADRATSFVVAGTRISAVLSC